MITRAITPAQLRRLQVLCKQYESHSLDFGSGREERLHWASTQIGRPVTSFSVLTTDEGIRLIDTLQRVLGVRSPNQSSERSNSRHARRKAGTEGRHDQSHWEQTLVGDKDIRRIQREMDRMGWTQDRLMAFLASPRGPNDRRTSIRTLGDANRVYWALKRMALIPNSSRSL